MAVSSRRASVVVSPGAPEGFVAKSRWRLECFNTEDNEECMSNTISFENSLLLGIHAGYNRISDVKFILYFTLFILFFFLRKVSFFRT